MTSASATLRRSASEDRDAESRLLELLRATADPLRLQVLRLLARDAWNVAELCQMLEVPQPALSHHLKLLVEAQLIVSRRDGRAAYYRRALLDADDPCHAMLTALLEVLDAQDLPAATAAHRQAVFEARRRTSEAFFARHADAFRAHQDLIAEPEQYFHELSALLPDHIGRALELGPGDGAFLPELCKRAETVVAVDTSAEMIAAARARCEAAGLDNLTLLTGDLLALRGAEQVLQAGFDLVILAMVLHHSTHPDALLAACADALAPQGQLLVAELCSHDADWVREAAGDVWQGFAPQELSDWAAAAGLQEGASQYLAQRNGFRIQVRAFARTG